jgi:hypothetical protein
LRERYLFRILVSGAGFEPATHKSVATRFTINNCKSSSIHVRRSNIRKIRTRHGSGYPAGASSRSPKNKGTGRARYSIASYILHMWIPRAVEARLLRSAKTRPVVVLTGARQTGKTSTFLRLFPKHAFVSLDLPVEAEQAEKAAGYFSPASSSACPLLMKSNVRPTYFGTSTWSSTPTVHAAGRPPNSACSEFVTNSRPLDWLLAFRLRFALPSP